MRYRKIALACPLEIPQPGGPESDPTSIKPDSTNQSDHFQGPKSDDWQILYM